MELGSWRGFSVTRALVRTAAYALALVAIGAWLDAARAQMTLTNDLILDNAALLMPRGSTYGRSINGAAFQTELLFTYNGYQYATWYRGTAEEDLMVARRDLVGNGAWQVIDSLKNFDNGDSSAWDAHNVISMGVSGDGRFHFSWDMHNHTLRYMNTSTGIATNPGAATWNSTIFQAERSALNAGGSSIGDVTYPQFITKANGDMLVNYRTGSSGSGNVWMNTYRANTGLWDAPHQIIDGTATGVSYSDPYGPNSTDRNAYINGMNIDGTGRIHMSWVWRETATGGSNHDISYAYSDDGGDTWRNNMGAVVGTLASPMTMQPQAANNSLGLIVVPMNRGNTLMNQQAQTADEVGGVHMVMWHKTDAAPPTTDFTSAPSAYFHYYRNPATGMWTRNDLPTTRAVGSRPDVAYDGDGNLYVSYISPGPGDGVGVIRNYYTEGDLIIATASRADGYRDWSIVSTDTRDWSGEPRIDQERLLTGGLVSIAMQENSDVNTGKTSTPLHVLEYGKLARHLVWDGDNAAAWTTGSGTDWDSDDNNAGDAAFAAGNRVTFDDGASAFNVTIPAPVATSGMTFKNTVAQSYSFTGSPIGGTGGLTIQGGGNVTLANGVNTYAGNTNVNSGKLTLTGSAVVAGSPTINLAAGATIDAAAATAGLPLSAQTLAGAGQVIGNLSAQTGSVVRVGGNGLPTTQPVTVVDDFADVDLSQYTQTVVNDATAGPVNVSFASPAGTLSATYSGASNVEQVMFLHNDVGLAVGSTLVVDVAMPAGAQEMDFGLMVSATDSPTASSGADLDTRDTFDWASISARPSQSTIRVNRSVNASVDTTTGMLNGVAPTNIAQLYIKRTNAAQVVVGYTNASAVNTDALTINYSSTNVGTAIGFYADLRTAGSLGVFDNLRIVGAPNSAYVGETLTVTGDASLGAGTTLALDVFSPAIGDKLAVSGNFAAGGLLDVNLAAGAPAPALGNVFDVIDFGSVTGSFDSFALPTLASGLAWNLSTLTTVGALEVVVDVDLDNSGLVDGEDFLLIQRTDPTLIAAWKPLFGSRLAAPIDIGFAAVPEPTTALLTCMLASTVAVRRRKRS